MYFGIILVILLAIFCGIKFVVQGLIRLIGSLFK